MSKTEAIAAVEAAIDEAVAEERQRHAREIEAVRVDLRALEDALANGTAGTTAHEFHKLPFEDGYVMGDQVLHKRVLSEGRVVQVIGVDANGEDVRVSQWENMGGGRWRVLRDYGCTMPAEALVEVGRKLEKRTAAAADRECLVCGGDGSGEALLARCAECGELVCEGCMRGDKCFLCSDVDHGVLG